MKPVKLKPLIKTRNKTTHQTRVQNVLQGSNGNSHPSHAITLQAQRRIFDRNSEKLKISQPSDWYEVRMKTLGIIIFHII